MKRRTFLRRSAVSGVIAATGRLLAPANSQAAAWPNNAFSASSTEDIAQALYGTRTAVESDAVKLSAPMLVEDGAVVPLSLSADLPAAESMAIIVDKNPHPLAGRVDFAGAEPFIGVRIKMIETSMIRCLAYADGKLYMAQRLVRVAVGGFGRWYSQVQTGVERASIPTTLKLNQTGDVTEIRCQINHPMETGRRIDRSNNQKVPAHFIQKLIFEVNGRQITDMDIGSGISRDPVFIVRVKGAKTGDSVVVTWTDNLGEKGGASATVA